MLPMPAAFRFMDSLSSLNHSSKMAQVRAQIKYCISFVLRLHAHMYIAQVTFFECEDIKDRK